MYWIKVFYKYNINLEGKHVVVLGKSKVVGLPVSLLAMCKGATVTICHSKTQNIETITQMADILITACGQPLMVKKEWIKEDVIIIDVGINSIEDKSKKRGYRLVGDVDFDDVIDKVRYITPVPGGVGPMTIAMLMEGSIK